MFLAVELHGTVFICTPKASIFVTMAVLGLYEPFTHERTIVVWCVSGDGVAMLSRCGGGIAMAIQYRVMRSLYRLEWMI